MNAADLSPPPAFHAGERAMQARAGALERMTQLGPHVLAGNSAQQAGAAR